MLINVYTKMYTEIHFYMPYKTQKAPPQRSLKNFSKNADSYGIDCRVPLQGPRNDFAWRSLTAPQGERSDHARMGIAEPKGSYTAGVESTVYRGMLSELNKEITHDSYCCLNPLYIVECFRREYPRMQRENRKLVLIHCVSWNAFGVVTMLVRDDRPGKS